MTYIHKEIYGQGKAIVLIHGWAMHTGVWREFAQQLAAHYRVICLDLPGHGLSEPVEPYFLDEISNALINAIPDQTFTVLGWSLGASVAISMANQYPDRIESLILLAGNPRFAKSNNWTGVHANILTDFDHNLALNHQATVFRFLALQVNGLTEQKKWLKQLKKIMEERGLPSKNTLQKALNLLITEDLRGVFSSLQCPTYGIYGGMDGLVPVQVAMDMQRIKPNCKTYIIPQAGHIPFLSHQETVVDIIHKIV